jgi:ubiquinone/menaquinone biosynthesis C-methylase UbiE
MNAMTQVDALSRVAAATPGPPAEPEGPVELTTVEQVFDQLTGFWRTAVMRAAFELNVPQHIGAGRLTAAAIAAAEGADVRGLTMVLDVLASIGILNKSHDSKYTFTPLVEAMLRVYGAANKVWMNDSTWGAWGKLSTAIRTGTPQRVEHWPTFVSTERHMMLQHGTMIAKLVCGESTPAIRVLDVGCGAGAVSYGFLTTNPNATAVGVDSPAVTEVTRSFGEELGVADRMQVKVLDVLSAQSYGTREFDVVIASNLFHLFDEATNEKLLETMTRALRPGGRIVINEVVPDDERRRSTYTLLFGLQAYLNTPGGRSYTFREMADWLARAGYETPQAHKVLGYATIIVAALPEKTQ